MVDYKLFEETATGRFYKVYKDGVEVSQHYTEREAIESAQEVKFQYWNSDVKYVHEYEVEVGLTDAGITEAQDYGTPQDTPPTINSTPSPSFTVNGIEQTYDMTQHVSDDGVSAVTYELLNILPNGLSFDANTGVLTYDGIEGAQVSQHQLRATDAVGSATSNSFDITIAASTSEVTVEQYKVLEFVFTASVTPTNPFDTYLLKLRLTDPNSQPLDVEGYFDGDGLGGQTGFVWKCRVCPDVVGNWSWTTIAGDQADPQLVGLSGQFTVNSGTDVGGVTAVGQYFQYQNGDDVYLQGHFLDNRLNIGPPLGTSITTHVYPSQTHVTDAERAQLLSEQVNYHTSNKINLYYVSYLDYQGQHVNPWTGTHPNADKTQMNLATWRAWDGYLEDFKDNGMHASMWGMADDLGGTHPNITQAKRLFRYAMARQSAYNHTSFTLALEYAETYSTAQMNDLGAYVQTKNPWNRLVTVHHNSPCLYNFAGQSWCDYAATQSGFSMNPATVNACAINIHDSLEPNNPHIDEEFFHDQGGSQYSGRLVTWANFAGGAAGGGTGAGLKSFMRFLSLSKIPHQRMTHNNASVDDGGQLDGRFAMSETNQHHFVYTSNGAPFNFIVTGSGLQGYWYNPRSDTSTLQSIGTINAGSQLFTPPASGTSNDWVLWITSGNNLNTGNLYTTAGAAPTVVNVESTALQLLANSMNAGEWRELTTNGLTTAITDTFIGTSSGENSITVYSIGGDTYDPVTKKIYYIGGDHPGEGLIFAQYDEATNTWSSEIPSWVPPTPADGHDDHSYSKNTLDKTNRHFIYGIHRYNIDTQQWISSMPQPTTWARADDAWSVMPDLGVILSENGGGNPSVWKYDGSTWTRLQSGLAAWSLHNFSIYNPVKNHVIFGGGDIGTNGTLYRLNSDETVDGPLNTPPVSYLGPNTDLNNQGGGLITCDPVSGKLLHLEPDGTFWEWDTVEDTWELLDAAPSFMDPDIGNTGAFFPIEAYGVVVLIEHNGEPPGTADTKMWVYKHADSESLSDLENDPDVLTILDFENVNRGRYEEAYFIGSSGISTATLTDTNDPGGYLRNHPNAGFYATNNTLNSPGVNYGAVQGSWNSPFNQWVHRSNNRTSYMKHKENDGEFANRMGSDGRWCMEAVIPTELGGTGAGDIKIPIKREQALSDVSSTQTFTVAGARSEIWVRLAIWHSQEWIDNPQGGVVGGPKWFKIHGDYTSQNLEFSAGMKTQTSQHLLEVYSDSGWEFTSTWNTPRSHKRDWAVFHLYQKVSDSGYHSGASSTTITDPNTTYATNELAGLAIQKNGNPGNAGGTRGTIISNSGNQIVTDITFNNGDSYAVRNGIQRVYYEDETSPSYEYYVYDDVAESDSNTSRTAQGWETGFNPVTDPDGTNPGYWNVTITTQHTGKPSNTGHPDLPVRYDNIVISKRRIKPLRPK